MRHQTPSDSSERSVARASLSCCQGWEVQRWVRRSAANARQTRGLSNLNVGPILPDRVASSTRCGSQGGVRRCLVQELQERMRLDAASPKALASNGIEAARARGVLRNLGIPNPLFTAGEFFAIFFLALLQPPSHSPARVTCTSIVWPSRSIVSATTSPGLRSQMRSRNCTPVDTGSPSMARMRSANERSIDVCT